MLTFTREPYKNIITVLDIVAPDISREVDIYPDAAEPNINHEKLISMGDSILTIVARNEDQDIVGFTVSIITPDVLFQHILTSYSVLYYLAKPYRGGGNGTKLFEETERWYDKLGVERSFLPRKLHMDNKHLFTKLDYIPVEVNYTKYRG